MPNNTTQLICQPFPPLSTDLPTKTRDLLLLLESALAMTLPSKMLVKTEGALNLPFSLLFVDRLLRFTSTRRVLLLTSSAFKPDLIQAWKAASSLEDSACLSKRYRTAYSPQISLEPSTHVCISAVREMQFCLQHSPHICEAFDVVLIYEMPIILAPLWQQVLESFSRGLLIGFCEAPTPKISEWFGNTPMSVGEQTSTHRQVMPSTSPSSMQ